MHPGSQIQEPREGKLITVGQIEGRAGSFLFIWSLLTD